MTKLGLTVRLDNLHVKNIIEFHEVILQEKNFMEIKKLKSKCSFQITWNVKNYAKWSCITEIDSIKSYIKKNK